MLFFIGFVLYKSCECLCMQEGIEALKSTMDAKKDVYGEYSTEMADTWKLIGNVYLAMGEMEKALRSLNKVKYIIFNTFNAMGLILLHIHTMPWAHIIMIYL